MADKVLRDLMALRSMSYEELQSRWRELYDSEPPSHSVAVLVRRLAYRIQELAYGGLSEATVATLIEISEDDELNPLRKKQRHKHKSEEAKVPLPGTRLSREWNGTKREVTLLDGGAVEFQGRRYRSLSAVARFITETRVNGPRFFGLRNSEQI